MYVEVLLVGSHDWLDMEGERGRWREKERGKEKEERKGGERDVWLIPVDFI